MSWGFSISCLESGTATPDLHINQSFDLIGQIDYSFFKNWVSADFIKQIEDFLKNKTQINEWKTIY